MVPLTSNLRLIDAPGNVLLPARVTELSRDSVANVSQLITLDHDVLSERVGKITPNLLRQIEEGLRLVLDL